MKKNKYFLLILLMFVALIGIILVQSFWIKTTIDNNERTKNVKNIEVLPISGLMGEAIKRISNSTSVSDLFK